MKYLDRDSEFDEKGAYKVKGNLLTLTPMAQISTNGIQKTE